MSDSRVTIYTPNSSINKPWRLLRDMFVDLADGRELAWRLAVRDIRAQYRQAFLGFLWAFIVPIANTGVWLFLSGSGIVAVGETLLPYPVYVFVGTMLWGIFMDAINTPLQVANASRTMLAKVNFPREALILSGIYQNLFNAAIKVALLLAVPFYLGMPPDIFGLLLFLLGVLSLILAGNTVGLILTPVGMLYTDIGRALPLLLQFVMYLTPVLFPMPKTGWAVAVFEYNPLTPLILTTRDWLTGLPPEYFDYFILVNACTFGLLLIFWVVYRLAMPILIERMSA